MLTPGYSSEEPEEDELVAPENWSPSFEELMMLVFSGPMRFECVEENEIGDESEDEEDAQNGTILPT